jgi:hypothetical protein
LATSLLAYVAIWFVLAAYNMWYGVNHAGYTYREEFPIFLGVFGVPAAIALLIRWKFA